jgi:hypothetical protein
MPEAVACAPRSGSSRLSPTLPSCGCCTAGSTPGPASVATREVTLLHRRRRVSWRVWWIAVSYGTGACGWGGRGGGGGEATYTCNLGRTRFRADVITDEILTVLDLRTLSIFRASSSASSRRSKTIVANVLATVAPASAPRSLEGWAGSHR